jgi:hypothetical protein
VAERAGWWLVEDGPEHAQVLDGLEELAKPDRLDHVGVHAELVAALQVRLLTGKR